MPRIRRLPRKRVRGCLRTSKGSCRRRPLPIAPAAEPLAWRPGVAHNRTAADDGVNTYIVERHSSTRWELCSWNSTTFDDVEGLAGTMTPTRERARSIAAEYSAAGERYRAADHGGQSRATAAIITAYNHERARHAAAPPAQVTAAAAAGQ